MPQLIAAAVERLAFPSTKEVREPVVDHDPEVAARMAGVRDGALLKKAAKGHMTTKD